MHRSKGDEHICIGSSRIYVPGKSLATYIANQMILVVASDAQDADFRPDLIITICGRRYSPLGQTRVKWVLHCNEQ